MSEIQGQGCKVTKVGKCAICQKDTLKSCPKCLNTFYCNAEHRNMDKSSHKKICKVVNPPCIEITKLLQQAANIFTDRYVIDQKVAFTGTVPFGIKAIDGKKVYLVNEMEGMGIDDSYQVWRNRRYTHDDFWSLFCVGKAQFFHYAFVSALRSIMSQHGISVEHEGKPIVIFGTAQVKVVTKGFERIVTILDWTSKNENEWKKLENHTETHEVIWISLGNKEKYLIDFCSPCNGIYSYNKNEKPLYFTKFDDQSDYQMFDLSFADAVDNKIENGVKAAEKTKDIRPSIVVNLRNKIIEYCIDTVEDAKTNTNSNTSKAIVQKLN